LNSYESLVTYFLQAAAEKGIAVDAESGWRNWGEPEFRWKPDDILSFVADYNAAHSIKFRGVQYDVEPYLLPQYSESEGDILTQYVQMAAGVVSEDKSYDIPLSFDIPHFYDSTTGWTPKITVDGNTNYTFNQLVGFLGEIPGSRLIVMAYSNYASGKGGTISLSQSEIDTADESNVKIIVGQETGPVSPSYTTFYGMTKAQLSAQMDIVQDAFAADPSFAGMAVDYLDYFDELR
jgi:hypothetical protein